MTGGQIYSGVFTGVPNNGAYTAALLTSGQGFNAVGNPYPSTVSGYALLTQNNAAIDGALYFYEHTLGAAAAGTNFSTWNLTGGVPATTGTGGTGANPSIPDGTIKVGQGFLVKAKTAANFDFANMSRVGNAMVEPTIEKNRLWLTMSQGTTPLNTILVGYVGGGATDGIDNLYDAPMLSGSGSEFYSTVGSNKLTIQGRALPFDSAVQEIPLGYKAVEAGSYTISLLSNFDGLFAGTQNVWLWDKTAATTTALKTGSYTFTSAAGEFATRFSIIFDLALSGSNPINADPHSVIAFYSNKNLHVNASTLMKSVRVFDINGRFIYEKTDINATEFITDEINVAQQVMLVEIITDANIKVVKKIVF